jgi:hypothetical protein
MGMTSRISRVRGKSCAGCDELEQLVEERTRDLRESRSALPILLQHDGGAANHRMIYEDGKAVVTPSPMSIPPTADHRPYPGEWKASGSKSRRECTMPSKVCQGSETGMPRSN